ncbi:hypothetical protein F4825DRAFT_444462 [Nemania diffusa]|nr:hypothetical protein F4825DRAFT_444462 [Nemania diffusa]
MERPQTLKRRRVESKSTGSDDPRPDTRPVKIQRREHQEPPEFWDRLSRVPLVPRALKEFDRRNRTRLCFPSPAIISEPGVTGANELLQFASNGGPDLSDLRGYALRSSKMNSLQGQSTTTPNTGTYKTKKTATVYHLGFELHLADYGIYLCSESQVQDPEWIKPILSAERPISEFSNFDFRSFQAANFRAKDEEDIKVNVMPTILGTTDYLPAWNTQFGNLQPLTDGSIAAPQPDLYYGANPRDLEPLVRKDLSGYIIPSSMLHKPLAPNFFIEPKGPSGDMAVANRQVCYDGAIGARGMHYLRNYGVDEPTYDGRACSFSVTYHEGTLKIYAHYAMLPAASSARPEYHMAQVNSYSLTGTLEVFIEGVTAFRNVRDLAKQYRDAFIQDANSRFRNSLGAAQ